MLNKLVIHLKNIIFFKTVIYVILTALLFALIPVFKENLLNESQKQHQASSFLQTAMLRLESIVDFEDKIVNTNKKYAQLTQNYEAQGCIDRIQLINTINSLSQEFNLLIPLKTRISRVYDLEQISYTNGPIKLHYYEVNINFTSIDYYSLLMICQKLYTLLPNGSVVVSTNIRQNEALTPKVIDHLNANISPGLIDVKIKIYLREIAYEK